MLIADYLHKNLVLPDLAAVAKSEALTELVEPLKSEFPDLDLTNALQVLLEREQLGTTGIGDGVAIPHGKLVGLDRIILVVGRSRQGVRFESLDGKSCTIFFLVLAPEQAAGMHLRILAHISKLLKDEGFRRSFLEAEGRDELYTLLKTL